MSTPYAERLMDLLLEVHFDAPSQRLWQAVCFTNYGSSEVLKAVSNDNLNLKRLFDVNDFRT